MTSYSCLFFLKIAKILLANVYTLLSIPVRGKKKHPSLRWGAFLCRKFSKAEVLRGFFY